MKKFESKNDIFKKKDVITIMNERRTDDKKIIHNYGFLRNLEMGSIIIGPDNEY